MTSSVIGFPLFWGFNFLFLSFATIWSSPLLFPSLPRIILYCIGRVSLSLSLFLPPISLFFLSYYLSLLLFLFQYSTLYSIFYSILFLKFHHPIRSFHFSLSFSFSLSLRLSIYALFLSFSPLLALSWVILSTASLSHPTILPPSSSTNPT